MTAITEQIVQTHRIREILRHDTDVKGVYVGCACGLGPVTLLCHTAHVAEATETAVAAATGGTIATEIESRASALSPLVERENAQPVTIAVHTTLLETARIARASS